MTRLRSRPELRRARPSDARPGGASPPLARALSKLRVASRREAHQLIAAGRVRVNGRVVTDASMRVNLATARIVVDDGPIVRNDAPRVIAFHKPRGTVTTRRDPQGRRTIFDVLGDAGAGLVAVGRLDLASTGLILLTNDTALANSLTDPENQHVRTYVVTVRGRVLPDEATTLERGLDVAGAGGSREHLRASRVTIRKASGRETHLIVALREGRNREIRRLFSAIDHEVTRLHRIAFAGVELGALQPGEWREVTLP